MDKITGDTSEFITESYPGEIIYQLLGEMAKVQGWPGFRNRPGRIGLDPLDTSFEEAHIEGVILRKLMIGEVFTTNPFYLFGMTFFGIVFVLPLIMAFIDYFPNLILILLYFPSTLSGLMGIFLLRNVYLSIQWAMTKQGNDDFVIMIK